MLVVGLAGCRSADAQPAEARSGIAAPAGWQAAPAIAAAARVATTAAAGAVTVDGAEAWAEPAMGCYAMWLALHGDGGTPDELAAQVVEGITAEKITTSDVTPVASGTFWITFARPPFRGRLRTRVGEGKLAVLACFANDREPAACEPACNTMLEGFR